MTRKELEAFILKHLRYEAETGKIYWIKRCSLRLSQTVPGTEAGFLHEASGYRYVGCGGKPQRVHRVAWLLFYGVWPPAQIDHINGNRADNRIVNLRLADNTQNQRNAATPKNSETGYKGVSFSKMHGKYRAYIKINYKQIWLGYHKTAEEAARAYNRAAAKYFGEFARANVL